MNIFDELSSGGEVGPASGVVAGSNQAATGAGNGGVVPVPVAAQPLETHAGYPGSGLARCGAPIGAYTVAPGEEFTCKECQAVPVAAHQRECTHQAGCPVHGDVRDCEPVPVAAHHQTAGWSGVPGECGVECACGTIFDHFDTIAEAAALLDGHIEREAELARIAEELGEPIEILREMADAMAACGEEEQIERKLHAQTLAQSQPVPVAAHECTCPPPAAGGIVGVNRGHLLGCPELTPKTGFVHPLLHINYVQQRPGIEPCFDCGRPMDDNYTEPNRCAGCHAKQVPVPVAAPELPKCDCRDCEPVPVAALEADDERRVREDWQSIGADDEPAETPEQSAAIVDANLRGMGSRGLDAADRQIATIKAHFTRRIDTLLARAERAEQQLAEQSVPVAAQPRYVLDAPAILDMVGQYAEACVEAATTGSPKGREDAREQIRDLWDAIRGALTPVPDVEPGLRWGSGPLVDHNPETPGTADPIPCPSLRCRCPWCRQMRDPAGELK